MGIHSGPVNEVTDLNAQANIAGAGINIAQRVMDCGDAGHILVSKRVADDLEQYSQWRSQLHDLGECEVKHGVHISVINLYNDEVGNPEVPEKFRKALEVASSAQPKVTKSAKPYLVLGIVSLAALAILAFLFGPKFFRSRNQAALTNTASPNDSSITRASAKSIAVLPFENLSSDKENAYFAEGIQDEILTRLSKIGALKVISRTSTSHYASSPQNLPEIARQLGVANILEGSVQKIANAVHVNVQLIRAAGDDHLWAESYDRNLVDIFAVEREVAQSIAAALNAKLTGAEEHVLAQKATDNPAAYDAYLKGIANWRTDGSKSQTVESLENAVRTDPGFALAWAALARSHSYNYFYYDTTPARRNAAEQALAQAERLQPDLPETQLARAYFQYWVLQDFKAAHDMLPALRSIWPNNSEVIELLAYTSARLGQWRDGMDYLDQAIRLNPQDPVLRQFAAFGHLLARDFSGSERVADEALQIWPTDTRMLAIKAQMFQALGQLDKAQSVLDRVTPDFETIDGRTIAIWYEAMLKRDPKIALELFELHATDGKLEGEECAGLLFLADLQELSGRKTDAQATLARARDTLAAKLKAQPDNPSILANLGWAFARLGQRELALSTVEKAINVVADERRRAFAEETRARILARFGDKDRAIASLPKLLTAFYDGWASVPLTPALLRLDPDWDNLRGDPRFQKLCEEKPK
jgi:TolB-like protein/regulator of sirC expression with transglutaminase-like and TPR domain